MALANGIVGLVDAGMCLTLAGALFAAGPHRRPNRSLTFLLLVEGGVQLCAALGNLAEPTTALAAAATMPTLLAILPGLYLLLLREVDTPLRKALARRGAIGLVIASTAAYAAWILATGSVTDDLSSSRNGVIVETVYLTTLFLGLAVGIWAFARASPGSQGRKQARLFIIAFAVRDIPFAMYFFRDIASGIGTTPLLPMNAFGVALPFIGTLLFVPVLAYAILSGQLFDIDIRIKRGLRRSMTIVAFLIAFFAASELTERFLAARWGPLAGLLAAGLLTFALRPLEAMTRRIADAAMPSVNESLAYVEERKLEVYRAAVESAHESGGISERERLALARLRQKLDVPEEAATQIERAVVDADRG